MTAAVNVNNQTMLSTRYGGVVPLARKPTAVRQNTGETVSVAAIDIALTRTADAELADDRCCSCCGVLLVLIHDAVERQCLYVRRQVVDVRYISIRERCRPAERCSEPASAACTSEAECVSQRLNWSGHRLQPLRR